MLWELHSFGLLLSLLSVFQYAAQGCLRCKSQAVKKKDIQWSWSWEWLCLLWGCWWDLLLLPLNLALCSDTVGEGTAGAGSPRAPGSSLHEALNCLCCSLSDRIYALWEIPMRSSVKSFRVLKVKQRIVINLFRITGLGDVKMDNPENRNIFTRLNWLIRSLPFRYRGLLKKCLTENNLKELRRSKDQEFKGKISDNPTYFYCT